MTIVDRRRYWLMALGEESRLWDSCHAEGVVRMGDDDVGDLRRYESKAQLKKQGYGMHDALAYWEFCRVMKPGDTIFVKKGARLVLGHGVVRSDYRFDEARPEYKHVRDVEWLSRTDGVRIREMAEPRCTPCGLLRGRRKSACKASVTRYPRRPSGRSATGQTEVRLILPRAPGGRRRRRLWSRH